MKKIYESPLNSWDESAERVTVFALESDEEFFELDAMNHMEKLEYFGLYECTGWAVAPGDVSCTYSFNLSGHHMTVYECLTLNV